jgi:adenosylmethionine-8-amino-7-oxononanoate aminotransferase
VALAALRRLRDDGLIDRSRDLGAKLHGDLSAALTDVRIVGDVRGLGMMLGIEVVAERESKEPFPRYAQVTERVLATAREAGLLLYSSTGHVDGTNGDLIMLGPPFTLTDEDVTTLVERTVDAIRSVSDAD